MRLPRLFNTDRFLPLFLLVLSILLYWPALHVFFSLDDLNFLLRASGLEDDPLRLSRVISTQLLFRAAWMFFKAQPWLYHLVIIFIHAANAGIVSLIALRLGLGKLSAYAAATLFIATPAAFHPLYWISGVQEVSAAFFALLAVYYYLGEGNRTIVLSLATAVISLLCKETTFLLLPVLALMTARHARRRLIVGGGAFLLGLAVIVASGKLAPRAAGNPYETAFGMNIVWNLLTYNAWLIRPWEFFPDNMPQFDRGLAVWGLLLPILICISLCCFARIRRSLLQATILFLALLAPVLPLVRHSYLYYLYIPLIPFWLFLGGVLGRIPKRSIAAVIIAVYVSYSIVFGMLHRRIEISDGVLKDPILRYATFAENAVEMFRATGETRPGEYLFIIHRSENSIDLTGKRDEIAQDRLTQSTLFERALLGGRGLRLFFPEIQKVSIEYAADHTSGWEKMYIYWLSNVGMKYMGYGKEGRMNIAESSLRKGGYDRAQREIEIMLELQPDDPRLIFYLGTIALKQGNESKLDSLLSILEDMAEAEDRPGLASEGFRVLSEAAARR